MAIKILAMSNKELITLEKVFEPIKLNTSVINASIDSITVTNSKPVNTLMR